MILVFCEYIQQCYEKCTQIYCVYELISLPLFTFFGTIIVHVLRVYFKWSESWLLCAAAASCHWFWKCLTYCKRESVCYGFAKTVSNTSATCISHTVPHLTILARLFLWAAQEASQNSDNVCTSQRRLTRTLCFENAAFLFECLALCLNGQAAEWLLVRLIALVTSQECSLFWLIFNVRFWILYF